MQVLIKCISAFRSIVYGFTGNKRPCTHRNRRFGRIPLFVLAKVAIGSLGSGTIKFLKKHGKSQLNTPARCLTHSTQSQLTQSHPHSVARTAPIDTHTDHPRTTQHCSWHVCRELPQHVYPPARRLVYMDLAHGTHIIHTVPIFSRLTFGLSPSGVPPSCISGAVTARFPVES